MSSNGIASAQDYLRAQEAELRLPSGKTFRVRAPGLKFRFSNPAPEDLEGLTGEEKAQALAEFYWRILCEVCVQPRVSMDPREGELHPDRIYGGQAGIDELVRDVSQAVTERDVNLVAYTVVRQPATRA